MIFDLLRNASSKNLDFYIETPGGSGEAAEEIVKLIHNKFDKVTFVVSGEAKSAGTIMVLSGDEIMMTETGSLGPIDAQMQIGRTVNSAYDYVQWVEEKRKEAEKTGKLNPLDATMVAQITPGELKRAYHGLKFAEERVVEWLPKYKFRDWKQTETRKQEVTQEYKVQRASEIAMELTSSEKWRTHGRAIKINDLEQFLRIKRIDQDLKLADIVYRIQIVLKLFFAGTMCYKMFATANHRLLRNAVGHKIALPALPPQPNLMQANVVNADLSCPKCGTHHKFYAKFVKNPAIDADMQKQGFTALPQSNKIICSCGFQIDLLPLRNMLEQRSGKKVVF
jgi:hypothetical protein